MRLAGYLQSYIPELYEKGNLELTLRDKGKVNYFDIKKWKL